MSASERVLVVPRESVVGRDGWLGIRPASLEETLGIVDRDGQFRSRSEMEGNPRYKQVIPYLVLRDDGAYFLMRRTRAGGDARLHDRWSIGIGGHLNPGDATVGGGLAREWAEEIDAAFVPDFRFIGLLNDDETDVGRVHVGLVFVGEADGRKARIRETDKLEGAFAPAAVVASVRTRLETWSSLVFDHLEGSALG